MTRTNQHTTCMDSDGSLSHVSAAFWAQMRRIQTAVPEDFRHHKGLRKPVGSFLADGSFLVKSSALLVYLLDGC